MKLRIRHDAVTVWTTLSIVTSRLGTARTSRVAGLLALALSAKGSVEASPSLSLTAAVPSAFENV